MVEQLGVIGTTGQPHTSVIWLHGLGQNATSLMPVARGSGLTDPGSGVRHVFPNAPRQSPGLTGDTPARAWFHQRIFALDHADLPMLLASERELRDLVASEAALVGAERVVLAGFSQGASMALITALRHPERLGGLILYAPYLPGGLPIEDTRTRANADLPVWIGQGRYDWIVPLFIGEWVRDRLRAWGHPVRWHEYHDYPNTHEPFSGACADVRAFLHEVVASGGGGPV